ncbi:MAG: hypothetical protein GX620_07065 [Chloroflexi bacterium]|nr:hypothetical protein [Chloroflexota bacterium]
MPGGRLTRRWSSSTGARWLAVALLLVMFAQLTVGARHLSMTSDEPSHITAGITYLATGELWVPPRHGHPPLINAIAAWPLLLQPDLPRFQDLAGWGNDFSSYVRATWPLLGPIERLACITRLPIILLALVLGALLFRWTCELCGPVAGVLAVFCMTFDPNLLGHAQLDTTDLGMALTGFAALYVSWRIALNQRARSSPWCRARWSGPIVAGVLLGLTLAGKGSGFLYAPAMVLTLAWGYTPAWWSHRRLSGLWRWVGQCAIIGITALAILWAIYRFEVGPLPGGRIPLPFPSHIGLWRTILRDAERSAFLRGETKVGGWWWYFLYSTAIKTPIPLLLGIVAVMAVALRQGARWWWRTLPLWAFPAMYWLVAMRSNMNIGHRHLLPTYPFLYILIGQLVTSVVRMRKSARAVTVGIVAVLLVWYAGEAIGIYPFYLAYFNQLVGGPRNGYRHLADSNVDWGQSFIALREWMERESVDVVRLSYYTYVDPSVYGVCYEPLPPALGATEDAISRFAPQPGMYAISATPLQGVMTAQADLYDWFRHREPDAQIGYGLLIYAVQPEDVAIEWVAQCSMPVAPLSPVDIHSGEGRPVRISYFDCTKGWIYPTGSIRPGHTILARDSDTLTRPFVRERLDRGRLVYEQRLPGDVPAFVVYAHDANGAAMPTGQTGWAAPSEWPPAQVTSEGDETPLPAELDGPLTFLGHSVSSAPHLVGGQVAMDSYWRVVGSADGRWLSIMAHILADDGRLISGDDGLGVPIDQWRAGDVIVQHHVMELSADVLPGRYWVETGAYWLDSHERWGVLKNGHAVGDRLIVGEIRVEP